MIDAMVTSMASQGGGVVLPPTTEKLQKSFDLAIWYSLSLWPALHVAFQNGWGGENTSDKKDWFAGAVSTLFEERPDIDHEDLELFLLQVMLDEFGCNVEDESEIEVARTIMGIKKRCQEGSLDASQEVERRWRSRGQMKVDLQFVDNEADDDDEDDEDDYEEWDGFNDDVEMNDAPQLVPAAPTAPKEKNEPEVDDDGFTKVTGRKKKKKE